MVGQFTQPEHPMPTEPKTLEPKTPEPKTPEPKTLEDMFHDMLKDVYYAEKQIVKALPKMAKAANSAELKAAFTAHKTETEGQIERLSEVFELAGKPPRGKTCDAILGILEEGKSVMEDYADSPALDAGLVASAQAIEHYEMARYGTLRAWAVQLGMKEAAALLGATLAEETKADQTLSGLAAGSVNQKALAKAA
jgi:ferritin-like metal-binding protein YciE